MILVFGAFILGGIQVIKEFGLGLAGGIFVDAVFIRMALVPSLMTMLGKSNWWFPNWLDRILPRVTVHPNVPEDDGAQGSPPPAPAPEPVSV
jgi:RND superfamily putative drug exporter